MEPRVEPRMLGHVFSCHMRDGNDCRGCMAVAAMRSSALGTQRMQFFARNGRGVWGRKGDDVRNEKRVPRALNMAGMLRVVFGGVRNVGVDGGWWEVGVHGEAKKATWGWGKLARSATDTAGCMGCAGASSSSSGL
jgi:hypothetical protein